MRLIWLRHGETTANREKRYCGHLDPSLTTRGREQAKTAFRSVSPQVRPHVLHISDRSRCEETATPWLRDHPDLPVVRTPALRELSFGAWEGKTYDELMESDQEHLQAWIRDPWQVAPPGGETLTDLGRRLERWLHRLLQSHDEGETVLVVSHGGPIRWFYACLVAGDPGRFWDRDVMPGSWFVFRHHDGKWREEGI